MFLIASLNALIFLVLSISHFYWLIGGKRGMSAVVPTREGSPEKIFVPSTFSTAVVAIGLLLFGLIEFGNTNVFSEWVGLKYFQWANLLIAFILMARAVGDFNYVGFFKRKRNTVFARNDTRYYSPLCLFIALTSAFISLR